MKRSCKRFKIRYEPEVSPPLPVARISVSKNNTRIVISNGGFLLGHTSCGRSGEKGYVRRLPATVFKNARKFARHVLRKHKEFRGEPFRLVVCGNFEHALQGLRRGGFRFEVVHDGRHPTFNGCRRSKRRRKKKKTRRR